MHYTALYSGMMRTCRWLRGPRGRCRLVRRRPPPAAATGAPASIYLAAEPGLPSQRQSVPVRSVRLRPERGDRGRGQVVAERETEAVRHAGQCQRKAHHPSHHAARRSAVRQMRSQSQMLDLDPGERAAGGSDDEVDLAPAVFPRGKYVRILTALAAGSERSSIECSFPAANSALFRHPAIPDFDT
jgi:hypothetical protein